MKIYKILLGLAVTSHLTGCAAILIGYTVNEMVSHVDTALENNVVLTEPKEGKRARIRVAMADHGNYLGVRAYPNSECTGTSVSGNGMVLNPRGMRGGFEVSLNDQKLNMPPSSLNDENFVKAEMYATAHQPISFLYKGYGTRQSDKDKYWMVSTTCFVRVSFTPGENADYAITFAGGNEHCHATAVQLIPNNGAIEERPVQLKGIQDCEKHSDADKLMKW